MFNHAAFHPDDVEDARRGHPAGDLRAYADARRVVYAGQTLCAHFAGGLEARWPHHVFNALHGVLAPQRFGTIQHELYEVPIGASGRPAYGEYYGMRAMRTRGFLDVIGLDSGPPEEPFHRQAMWLPSTSVKLLVPEIATLPRMTIKTRPFLTLTDPGLGATAPSFRMSGSRFVSDELREAVGRTVGAPLEWLDAEFTHLEIAAGAIMLPVNGYRMAAGELDALVQVTTAVASGLAALEPIDQASSHRFDDPLPAPDATTHPAGYYSFDMAFDRSGQLAIEAEAASLGLVTEDPVAFHRRFRRLAIPGSARGVVAGRMLDSRAFGRVSWHQRGNPRAASWWQGAGVFEAAHHAPDLPVGGGYVASTGMFVEIVDGLACCWSPTPETGRPAVADLARRCLETMRAVGAANV